MRNQIYQLLLIGLMIIPQYHLNAKNLSILSQSRLDNFELLDVYIEDELAFIPAGLGGLNIVDISDPSNPDVVSSYRAGGCDWGRIYAWTVSGDFAYGAGRECGVHVINISNPADPLLATVYTGDDEIDQRYEHAETDGVTLFLSKHRRGVELVDISQSPYIHVVSNFLTHNAWASMIADTLLYIADGSAGIKIASVRNPSNPVLIGGLPTSGTAKDVSIVDDYLFVAVGAAGVDMIDVSDPQNPTLVDNYNTSGYASRVSANSNRIAVSDWDDVEVLSFDIQGMMLVGYKDTGGRVMALAMLDDIIFSAEWEELVVFQYEEIQEADIDLNTRKVEFPRVEQIESYTLPVTIVNNGQLPLEIYDAQIDDSDFEVGLAPGILLPDSSLTFPIHYQPGGGYWTEDLTIITNDPDEQEVEVKITGNYPSGPMVGDMAPEFELDVVNDLGSISTNELLGQPVVLAFFTTW